MCRWRERPAPPQVISAKNRGFLKGWDGETHALFIAFAPVASPRYAAACVVEHGGGGSRAAAPVVRDVMTEVLLRDPAIKTALLASNEGAAGAVKERKR